MNAARVAVDSPPRTRRSFVIGTRGSALARWQTEHVIAALQRVAPAAQVELRIIKTTGDRDQTRPLAELGGLGVFTKEIEHALLTGEIDMAVHSLKDLPTELSEETTLAAILEREDPRDCIVSRYGVGLMHLPQGAIVGTSSARRGAQVRALRPDLKIVPLRGNVDTRMAKAQTEAYDAIVIAAAGLVRLERAAEITEYLPIDVMVPDPGQGALAVQIRADDAELNALLAPLNHLPTRAAVTAERAFLGALGGGCRTPMGAYAESTGERLLLRGIVGTEDGTRIVRGALAGEMSQPVELGNALAAQVLEAGARAILEIRPALYGKRILVTRAAAQAEELAGKLRAQGGEPVEFAAIDFAPLENFVILDEALAQIKMYDWVVFTSANGVRAVSERLQALGATAERINAVRVAAIGPGTAHALQNAGVRVDFIPTQFLGEQIALELPVTAGERALLLRADIASDVLANGLTARQVVVNDIDAYRTVMPPLATLDLSRVDAVTFTSASTVRNLLSMLEGAERERLQTRDIFCIGPVTAETARELGLTVTAVASEHTLDGLVAAMCDYYERK